MAKFKDLTGQRFGKLTAIKIVGKNRNRTNLWLCKCDCGNEHITSTDLLLNGQCKSCSCLQKEKISKLSYRHGLHKTKIYNIWCAIKHRCSSNVGKNTKYYRDKGIKVCNEWIDKENGFINFYNWAMQNGYKEGLSIDRIDSNKNYCPENCRWVDSYIQNNNKSSNKYITYNNETYTLAQWCRKLGLNYHRTVCRLLRGWTVEKSFTMPKLEKYDHNKNKI